MTKKRGRPNKDQQAEQGYLDPEMAPVKIKAVTDACRIYYTAMSERVALSKEEHEAKDNLVNVMLSHDLTIYEYDDKMVSLVDLKNIKIKKKKEEPAFAE